VREGLGDAVDVGRVHGEGRADVPYRMAHPVRLRHRHGRDPLGAEPADDRAVDLQPARGLHVDVDVGQDRAALGQEAFHQQPVRDGVGVRDAEEVVDERARAGAARGDPDAHLPYVVDDLSDRQEVGGEVVVGDDVQLAVHPLPVATRFGRTVVAAQHHPRRRPRGQYALRGASSGADEVRLGEVHGTDAEVVLRVDEALGGGGPRLFEQAVGGVAAKTRGLDDPFGGAEHGARVLEPGLAAVQLLAGVDRHEPAGGVQDVGDRAHARVGVPDGVAEHRPHPLLGGEADGTGGQPQRAGAGALAPVPDRFETQGVAVDLPPGREQFRGPVGAPGDERPADVGGGPEQDGQAVGVVVRPGQQRPAGLTLVARMRRSNDSAELGPALRAVPGKEGHPGRRLIDEGTAPHGSPPPLPSGPPARTGLDP
jgi:hypothetical protein